MVVVKLPSVSWLETQFLPCWFFPALSGNNEPEVVSAQTHQVPENETATLPIGSVEENSPMEPTQTAESSFDFLGSKPKEIVETKEPLHEQLVVRWSAYLQDGVSRDLLEGIKEKYPLFENCPLLKPPVLGPEITSCLDAKTLRQDKFISHLQSDAGHALAALGSVINSLLESDPSGMKSTITALADTAQLLCNLQHALSTHRKYSIIPFLKYSSRKLVESCKTDEFLLGKNFVQELKASEAAKKTGLELKASYTNTVKPQSHLAAPSSSTSSKRNTPNTAVPRNDLNYKRQKFHNRKKSSTLRFSFNNRHNEDQKRPQQRRRY